MVLAWYKQYAADAVEKSPYMAPDGSIAYHESIVKKLPPTPKRKDKLEWLKNKNTAPPKQ